MKMSKRLLLLAATIVVTSGCDMAGQWERTAQRLVEAFMPEQHRVFSEQYFRHVLDGDFEAANEMVPADRYCVAWLEDAETLQEMQQAVADADCAEETAILERGLRRLPRGEPPETRFTRYVANSNPKERQIIVQQEFVYDNVVVRATMEYREVDGDARVSNLTLAFDNRSLTERMWGFMDATFGGALWWLFAAQFAAYAAVPFIVFWIIRRQRRRSETEGSGHLRA